MYYSGSRLQLFLVEYSQEQQSENENKIINHIAEKEAFGVGSRCFFLLYQSMHEKLLVVAFAEG